MTTPTHPTIASLVTKAAKSALDLLFPLYCLGCRREGPVLCEACLAGSRRLVRPFCSLCGHPGVTGFCQFCQDEAPRFDSVRAPFIFEGAVRQVVHGLKYRSIRAAAPQLGRILADYAARNQLSADVIAPVPLHPRLLRSRGYNQSQLLAEVLGRGLGLPVNPGLLARVRNSPPQVEAATRKQRQTNVAGIFQCVGEVEGLSILIVDDVATTGSTLSASAAALKSAGAKKVHALVLAREGLDN